MDPVTITATVVTFATAVKDLVELGQKIHESFAKVSKNRRSAQRAADNIKDMINDINTIYKNHQEALANMEEFDLALKDLLEKFRGFETSSLPLVPQTRVSWISMTFLRGWWNNNKIKESILDLEAEVREVKQKYMMKSAMRTEVKLEAVHQDATRGFADISHGLEVVSKDVHAIRVTTAADSTARCASGVSHGLDQAIIMFAQSRISTSTPLLRMPDVITEEAWTTAFIKLQIHSIAAEVEKVSTLCISGPSNTEPFAVTWFDGSSLTSSSLRRMVVRNLMDLRDALSGTDGVQALSMNRAAQQLNELSLQLSTLEMMDESILVGRWAVRLLRALVSAPQCGESQDSAVLAFLLYRLSKSHYVEDCKTSSQQLIDESQTITQNLLSQGRTSPQVQALYGAILVHHARLQDNNQCSIDMCIEAVQLYDGVLGARAITQVCSHQTICNAVVHAADDFVDRVFSSSPTPIMVQYYAEAIQCLARYVFRQGDSQTARSLALLSIALLREQVSVYGNVHQDTLALSLSWLCHHHLFGCFPDTELLVMAEECVLLLQGLTHKNPMRYSQHLVPMLWQKAILLSHLNRHADAIATYEDSVRLSGRLLQDSKLQADALYFLAQKLRDTHRYVDAARTTALIPPRFRSDAYISLNTSIILDLQTTGHYKESVELSQNVVALYRDLGVKRPGAQWKGYLVSALSTMACALISQGDNAQGLVALQESEWIVYNVLSTSVDTLPTEIEEYLHAIQTIVTVEYLRNREPFISTHTQHLEQLAARHPENNKILYALLHSRTLHAFNLYRFGRLQDALQYISQCHNTFTSTPNLTSKGYLLLLARMSWTKARTLNAQGNAAQGLLEVRRLRSILQLADSTINTIISIVYETQLEIDLGNFGKAQEIAEQALKIPQQFICPDIQSIWSLFAVLLAALSSMDYQRAMETGLQAIELFNNDIWQEDEDDEVSITIRPSVYAMMSSVEANRGRLVHALDYAQYAITLSLDIARKKHSFCSTMAEQSYMETRGYLAGIHLATGNITQAQKICDERRIYFTERVKDRMGEYRDLAPILRMLGVLCCHDGRHDAGEAAAKELTEIISRLGLVFPSLQEQVKIRLRYQASVPILKVLDDMTARLDCEHQKGITALFKE